MPSFDLWYYNTLYENRLTGQQGAAITRAF